MLLVQLMSNMSSRRHGSVALDIRHTYSLQPHQERLEKSACFLILLRNVAFFYMEINSLAEIFLGQTLCQSVRAQ